MKDARFTPSESQASVTVPAFGLLRVDPHHLAHQEAVRAAFTAGLKVFDLGWFPEENAAARLRLLAEMAAASGNPKLRILIRGNLGEASGLPEFFRGTEVPKTFLDATEWIYLIADPEFALKDFEGDHEALYGAIEEEFAVLEMQVRDGILTQYGIGSAAFTYSKEDPQYLSVEALLSGESGTASARPGTAKKESAQSGLRAVGKIAYPHFRAVEFPFNLYESAAYQFQNQSLGDRNVSLLEVAKAYGLTTYARRPLDALTDNQLLRLTAYPDHHRLDLDGAVMGTFEVAIERERKIAPFIEQTKVAAWAHRLRDQLRHVNDPEHWKEIRARKILPDLEKLSALVTHPSAREDLTPYLQSMDALLLAVQLWCEKRGAERNERLRAKIVSAVPALRGSAAFGAKPRTLPETAFLVYRSVPNLDVVLVGMRTADYVEKTAASFNLSDPRLSREELDRAFEASHAAIHSLSENAASPESQITH